MKIRSVKGLEEIGLPGNTFVIVDDLENRMGKSWIEVHDRAQQMPMRPLEVKLCMEADKELDDSGRRQLLGTALSRAILLISQQQKNARIYAECPAYDSRQLELLTSVGLVDNEALVSMKRLMDGDIKSVNAPAGCVLICDRLADEQERTFFLQRQEKIFGRENAEEWLAEIRAKTGMRRMMLIHDNGLAAELLCWVENGSGVIGMVYTAPAWRRKGAAAYLMESARQYFWQHRVMECRIEVRTRMIPMMRLAASVGYSRERVLMRLPGSDMDMQPSVKKPELKKTAPKAEGSKTLQKKRPVQKIMSSSDAPAHLKKNG